MLKVLLLFIFIINVQAKEIPAFSLPVFNTDEIFKIEDVLGKKIIILNFFASWCTSCISELPELHSLQKKYSDKKYIFLAINAGERRKIVKKFIKRYKFKYKILLDEDRKVSKLFKVEELPKTIVISLEKKIIFSGERPPERL